MAVSEDTKDRILTNWQAGHTLEGIATRLGITRNQAQRVVLMARKDGDKRAAHRPRSQPMTRSGEWQKTDDDEVAMARSEGERAAANFQKLSETGRHVTLIERGRRQCRWPTKMRDGVQLFCGLGVDGPDAPPDALFSRVNYCAVHRAAAVEKAARYTDGQIEYMAKLDKSGAGSGE